MKSSLIIPSILTLFILSSCAEQGGKSDNNGVVGQFYDNIAVITNDPDSDDAYVAKEDCIEMCKESDLSMNFPNEFKWMGLIDRGDNNLSIISYTTLLRKLANRNAIKFSYSIEDSYPYKNTQSDTTDYFQFYIIRKEYAMQDYKCSFIDTVLVSPDSLIVGIKNMAGGHAYTKSDMEEPASDVFTKE